LISADDRDAEHLDLWRLNQQGKGLHVAAAGSRAVFVDDDFATWLSEAKARAQQNE
jgi:hypothetical protein